MRRRPSSPLFLVLEQKPEELAVKFLRWPIHYVFNIELVEHTPDVTPGNGTNIDVRGLGAHPESVFFLELVNQIHTVLAAAQGHQTVVLAVAVQHGCTPAPDRHSGSRGDDSAAP